MKTFVFETRQWSRARDGEPVLECTIASMRTGWTVHGYEARLYIKGSLPYRSRVFLTRQRATAEADKLLFEQLPPVSAVTVSGGVSR